uniref:Uncharacterized protein n=1 Tax=Chromera velia CCMP2878 TaxID=1169474 RepID=A0A0G4I3B3_9ALVE|eukprot:Cvel_10626.t1-p1 / transcript=Cvel_10626.t1 / gene=Cvel_10626 / organism=Chromera_velia_CCMP2878 / gene_product=hypothetical protein / transcript_product=hypothetical protein / location=Cvel_scaffold645:37183-37518(+) / protein_length=112 / sequence_SO=supercontig / SO=protein_coding / is_pseudo=false
MVLFIFTTLEITGVIHETPSDPEKLQWAHESPYLYMFVWMALEYGTAVILPILMLLCPLGMYFTFLLLCWIVGTHKLIFLPLMDIVPSTLNRTISGGESLQITQVTTTRKPC